MATVKFKVKQFMRLHVWNEEKTQYIPTNTVFVPGDIVILNSNDKFILQPNFFKPIWEK